MPILEQVNKLEDELIANRAQCRLLQERQKEIRVSLNATFDNNPSLILSRIYRKPYQTASYIQSHDYCERLTDEYGFGIVQPSRPTIRRLLQSGINVYGACLETRYQLREKS